MNVCVHFVRSQFTQEIYQHFIDICVTQQKHYIREISFDEIIKHLILVFFEHS